MADPDYPIYHGADTLELPTSGKRQSVTGGENITRSWHGKRTAILALKPERGAVTDDGIVIDFSYEPEDGTTAILSVVYFKQTVFENGFVRLPRKENPLIELDFEVLERPIESHPTKGLVLGENGAGGPDYTALGQLEAWKQAPPSRKQKYQYSKLDKYNPSETKDDDWADLPENVKKIAALYASGQENYMVFAPVVTRTTVADLTPIAYANGTISTPPFMPGGTIVYQYVKMPDKLSQQVDGTWLLVETWKGALKWNADYYGASTSMSISAASLESFYG